jgi:hypothetical protein
VRLFCVSVADRTSHAASQAGESLVDRAHICLETGETQSCRQVTRRSLRFRSRFKWHTRATWSSREDRIPSLVWLALIWFGMIAGFGVDMPRFLHESPPPAAVVDVHAGLGRYYGCPRAVDGNGCQSAR